MNKLFSSVVIATILSILTATVAFAGMETLLSSGIRSASTNSSDIVKYKYRGAHIFAKISAASGTGTVTFRVQEKDIDGNYYDIVSSVATASTGTTVLKVYPGLTAAANTVANDVLGDIWRVAVFQSGVASHTYSVTANTME